CQRVPTPTALIDTFNFLVTAKGAVDHFISHVSPE
ncbi:MAG: hypothetical protein ACI9HK_004480, partial [Pirellulaceae bacterium]